MNTSHAHAFELAREATAHKRLSQLHKRVAYSKLEQLRRVCAYLGLDFEEVRSNATEGVTAHGRTERTD